MPAKQRSLFKVEFMPTPAFPDHIPVSFAVAPDYETAAFMVARRHSVPRDRVVVGDYIVTVLVINADDIIVPDIECEPETEGV